MNTKSAVRKIIALVLLVIFVFLFSKIILPPKSNLDVKVMIPKLWIHQISGDKYEYTNTLFRFALAYPANLSVKEYDDGTSASTITFEDAKGEKGFQIYVVPYADDHITKEQFSKDLSSGVMIEKKTMNIGNLSATEFYSEDKTIGETSEIWFIHNGFLFEITAVRSLDSWLRDIVKTWRFF